MKPGPARVSGSSFPTARRQPQEWSLAAELPGLDDVPACACGGAGFRARLLQGGCTLTTFRCPEDPAHTRADKQPRCSSPPDGIHLQIGFRNDRKDQQNGSTRRRSCPQVEIRERSHPHGGGSNLQEHWFDGNESTHLRADLLRCQI